MRSLPHALFAGWVAVSTVACAVAAFPGRPSDETPDPKPMTLSTDSKSSSTRPPIDVDASSVKTQTATFALG